MLRPNRYDSKLVMLWPCQHCLGGVGVCLRRVNVCWVQYKGKCPNDFGQGCRLRVTLVSCIALLIFDIITVSYDCIIVSLTILRNTYCVCDDLAPLLRYSTLFLLVLLKLNTHNFQPQLIPYLSRSRL